MLKNIYYYKDIGGRDHIKNFIDSLDIHDQQKALAYIALLKEHGHNLRRPIADNIGNGLYELRPKGNRVFYFFFLKDSAVLVHAIKKKTDEISKSDIQISLRRKNEFIERYNTGGLKS